MKVKRKIRNFFDSVNISGAETKKIKKIETKYKVAVCAAVGLSVLVLLAKEMMDAPDEEDK